MSDPLGGLNVGPPPSSDGGSSTPAPIGIPKHFQPGAPQTLTERYAVPAAGPFLPGRPDTFPIQEKSRYLSGFEFTPAGWSVEERARMQEALDASGLYNPNDTYARGFWDDNSATAFKRLLGYANQMGKDWEESIVELGTANQASAGRARSRAAAGRAPTYTEISSPDDLKLVFNRTARSSLGRQLSQGELDSMVQAYSGIEMGKVAQQAGATGDMVASAPPSPQAFAEGQVGADPMLAKEQYASKFAQKFSVLQNMLGGVTGLGGGG